MILNSAVLLISCPDKEGIVASVTTLLSSLWANIIHLEQQVDREKKLFFMRVEWDLGSFSLPIAQFKKCFESEVAQSYQMSWEIHERAKRQRMALFISRYDHCFFDLLGRWKSGDIMVDIPLIISNHEDLREETERFGIDFYHIPVTADTREVQVAKQLKLLVQYNIDFITLARYMQIIPAALIEQFPQRIINIHHSFLPGFPGAKPYHQAYERGVKLIGATAHYVTKELDAGPIIEQDVERVSQASSVEEYLRIGQDVERMVLARAIRAHAERRVLVCEERTVVFG